MAVGARACPLYDARGVGVGIVGTALERETAIIVGDGVVTIALVMQMPSLALIAIARIEQHTCTVVGCILQGIEVEFRILGGTDGDVCHVGCRSWCYGFNDPRLVGHRVLLYLSDGGVVAEARSGQKFARGFVDNFESSL